MLIVYVQGDDLLSVIKIDKNMFGYWLKFGDITLSTADSIDIYTVLPYESITETVIHILNRKRKILKNGVKVIFSDQALFVGTKQEAFDKMRLVLPKAAKIVIYKGQKRNTVFSKVVDDICFSVEQSLRLIGGYL